jgi:HlyD family secretion protein
MKKVFLALSLITLISACSGDQDTNNKAIEVISKKAWKETLIADGEIKTAASTSLNVPGAGWDKRRLLEMVPEGSFVKKGQLIARFDAPDARVKLSQAEIDLLRKAIIETDLQANAQMGVATLAADTSKVEGDLQLSRRYANTDLKIFAQNKILDVLLDIGFLNDKQEYLIWKNKQSDIRTKTNQAVVSSQKESVQNIITQQKKNLSDLELYAPHDGVFILLRKWDGSLPQVGGQSWAGDEFGVLPDLEQQIASFSVPEGQAFGLKEGLPVIAKLAGTGIELNLVVTKVGKNSSTKSRESPAKFSTFEAKLDQTLVKKNELKPGQAMTGKVVLLDYTSSLTVPNIALIQDGKEFSIYVLNGNNAVKKKVELGLRGPIRSEVKSGLLEGEKLLIVPEKNENKKNEETKK